MMKRTTDLLALLMLALTACSGTTTDTDTVSVTDAVTDAASVSDSVPDSVSVPDSASDSAAVPDAAADTWTFVREDYEQVRGWILLDSDRDAVLSSIEKAAEYGVNHIQLSHDLIMNIDEIIEDTPEVQARVATLNAGIEFAHAHDMKVYIWSHEFGDPVGGAVCFEPGDAVWEERAEVYREGLAKLPDLDGVIVMFGSAPNPPWYSVCLCDWCTENYPDELPLSRPPQGERVRLMLENIGGVIVNELGKEMFVRTFVHEPNEIDWHGEGLSTAQGVAFTGMHKGPVQDWQPYNPHHPNTGHIGPHPSVLELDLAGEYYGKAILPFCAPGYYRYRLKYLWENRGIGVVARIQRGSDTALGTPNEINTYAIRDLLADMNTPLADIWADFVAAFYGVDAELPENGLLRRILASTFSVRTKSHYALGIWALAKGSDINEDTSLGQFHERGNMPKWDPDWEEVWDRLGSPDAEVLAWLWQEGNEAVALADEALTLLPFVTAVLSEDDAADLERRLWHQMLSARAWRDVDLGVWAYRALTQGQDDADYRAWLAWAREDLTHVAAQMSAHGLDGVALASPARLLRFVDSTAGNVYEDTIPSRPTLPLFSPLRLDAVYPDHADISFQLHRPASVHLDYGEEMPQYENSEALGDREAGAWITVTLTDLTPGRRYVARLRSNEDSAQRLGSELWIHTPEPCDCPGGSCRDGRCEESCTPDCTGRCAGAPDGCGGSCATGDCSGCCDALGQCRTGTIWEACGAAGGDCVTCPDGQWCADGACAADEENR